MADYAPLLAPLKLRNLTLRNRLFSTGHASGLAEDGMPGEAYRLYHGEKAKGGIGLTIFGGSSCVSKDSPISFNQIDMSGDRILPYLERMAETVHGHGAAILMQITHMGRRGGWRTPDALPMVTPSASREIAHRSFGKEMEDFDFVRIRADFASAAERAEKGGLDGVEVLAAAHQLLDSFLSPVTNRRTDQYGGSLENRARFPLEVLQAMRDRTGPDFVIGLRLSGDEMQKGGLSARDCVEVSQLFAASGLVDYLSIYQGTGDTLADLAVMLPDMTVPSAAWLHLASAVKRQVDIPVFHASAIRDVGTAARAVADGHVDAVAMTRGHIADPHIVNKLREGREDDIRQCVGANYCADFAGTGGLCIQNPATGRERTQPHILPKAGTRRKVVVVGGGPGGLEAARACLQRGHGVVLFEAEPVLGGQLKLAAKVPRRENLAGIVRWLEGQTRRNGADLRLGHSATEADILAEDPDVVFIATGAVPVLPEFAGRDLCVTSWDIISGRVQPGQQVLVCDETGLPAGIGCADMLASRGAEVELVSADRMTGEEVGATLHVAYYRSLYRNGAILTPNHQLTGAYREGNRLIGVLTNLYTGDEEEREIDQIVHELGTLPRTAVYDALRARSRNLGEVDSAALIEGRPQEVRTNPHGAFDLYRIGDALVGRNVHAAIYDAARLAKVI
jgi:2,4-dienoyl-CoA reductase-like NADH-dependent reductase (Old Yellow Enzyme family)